MEEVDVTWGNSIPVWWSFFWRATVFSALSGVVLSIIAGIFVVIIGRPDLGATAGAIAGYVAAVPISMWCIKLILSKSFNGYSVRLVKTEST
jgi:hypothetical protein